MRDFDAVEPNVGLTQVPIVTAICLPSEDTTAWKYT